jgi:hypothetical protein
MLFYLRMSWISALLVLGLSAPSARAALGADSLWNRHYALTGVNPANLHMISLRDGGFAAAFGPAVTLWKFGPDGDSLWQKTLFDYPAHITSLSENSEGGLVICADHADSTSVIFTTRNGDVKWSTTWVKPDRAAGYRTLCDGARDYGCFVVGQKIVPGSVSPPTIFRYDSTGRVQWRHTYEPCGPIVALHRGISEELFVTLSDPAVLRFAEDSDEFDLVDTSPFRIIEIVTVNGGSALVAMLNPLDRPYLGWMSNMGKINRNFMIDFPDSTRWPESAVFAYSPYGDYTFAVRSTVHPLRGDADFEMFQTDSTIAVNWQGIGGTELNDIPLTAQSRQDGWLIAGCNESGLWIQMVRRH